MEEEKIKFNGNDPFEEKECIGTVVSDSETPTFEIIRVKLRANKDVKPGTLLRIPTQRNNLETILIARVKSAHEFNPNEDVGSVAVRDSLQIEARYPTEEDSTTIFRLVEADLIEEITNRKDKSGKNIITAPETLPNSGAEVYLADPNEIVAVLGLAETENLGLNIGTTTGGISISTILKREIIQRHLFICGTTGSGKSYSMGVITEELIKHNIPVIFIDTQDEYAEIVKALGGKTVEPGKDFSIRISSLTEFELIDILPDSLKNSSLQPDVVGRAFGKLKMDVSRKESGFGIEELIKEIGPAAEKLTYKKGEVPRVEDSVTRRLEYLQNFKIFGQKATDWSKLMYPCLSIRCKKLTTKQLNIIATAVLRELQNLRLDKEIPPYMMVIDEAHLFVPQGENSACKQIIREGVRIGRHHGIMMTLLTQSPVDIDKSVIRQCNTRLVFALEKDQLDAIQGVKADATDEMLRALPKMPQGTCLLSGTYETIKHTIPVKIREKVQTKNAKAGETPNIFSEVNEWLKSINRSDLDFLKKKKGYGSLCCKT